MKARFAVRGSFNRLPCTLRWSNGVISGDQAAVDEYWKIEKAASGKMPYGLFPAVTFSDYHLHPLAANAIFHEIMPDAELVVGQEYYDEITGADDPEDAVY